MGVRGLMDVADVRSRVERCLSQFLDSRLAAVPGQTSSQLMLLEPVKELVVDGGKRLRAAFCYWGWRGACGVDDDRAVAAGAAIELLHAGGLIHDDVMDSSSLRRGRPSMHRRLATEHAARHWRGSSTHFGLSAAIVAGDLCFVWADELLRSSGFAPPGLERAGKVYDEMRAETIRGQFLDLSAQASGAHGVEEALLVARTKTATGSVAGPLQFGGALAGAGQPLLDGYATYGLSLGLAFQLQDDLLGAYGDARVTGKPSGDDLRDGKCTLLLAEARRRAGPAAAARIDALIGNGTDSDVGEVRLLIDATGARAHVEDLIQRLGAEALDGLDKAPLEDPLARQVLRDIAVGLTTLA